MPSPKFLFSIFSLLALLTFTCNRPPEAPVDPAYREAMQSRLTLPNGWSLTPVGKQLPLGDLPLNMLISADQKRVVVINNGYGKQGLMLFDVAGEKKLAELELPKSWYGLAWSRDGKRLYASGANDNKVHVVEVGQSSMSLADSIVIGRTWPKDTMSVAGLALDENRNKLYAVCKVEPSLYILDLAGKKVEKRVDLGAQAYDCVLSPDGNTLYISLWGGGAVLTYDLQKGAINKRIPVDRHPNDMVFSRDGKRLFVACSDANTVNVIDLAQGRVLETIVATLYPDSPTGSTSNSVALSPDGNTLLIANADNNCLALFDVARPGRSRSLGFIPTGWYPTAVEVIGDQIWVANGKGVASAANPKGPQPGYPRTNDTEYIGGLFLGTLNLLKWPAENTLASYTQLVYENTPYNKDIERNPAGEPGNPVPNKLGAPSPIKYIYYVIKENRTYDQVFGDMPQGNSDPSLCLFPDSVTPNHHALAREFVLLDNFYVNAEVSADGHNWSTAAYANDYVEKSWPTSYGGRGGHYDYEGRKEIAYPRDGFIWDFCKRAGISFRTYGEFANLNEAYHGTLKGHTCGRFPGYDLRIKDVYRFEQWRIDFDSLIALGKVPRFNIVRFGNDHTAGARDDSPTPAAMVADNDLALGRFVEHLSKSSIWKETAIFVLEDDAQNGPDHVDAHRSPCLVISPYVKHGYVDHTMYSTASALRTMELILGLPPMSQYDAAATPMYASFQVQPVLTPYQARPNRVPLDRMNPPRTSLSKQSWQLNLDKEDQAPDILFSEIVWKAVRGEHSVMPAPRKSAFVRMVEEED